MSEERHWPRMRRAYSDSKRTKWARTMREAEQLAEQMNSGLGPHIDHCHRTNRVRGLLCHPCNTRLAGVEHPLRNTMIQYLEQHERKFLHLASPLLESSLGDEDHQERRRKP